MSAGQVSEQHARFLTTGRVVLATCALLSLPAAFAQTRTDMADAADKLAALAKAGDAEAMPAQIKVVGDTCGACHRTYRQR